MRGFSAPRNLSEVFSRAKLSFYPKGSIIIRPGELYSTIYLIQEGFIEACVITSSGEEKTLLVQKKGEIFPLSGFYKKRNDDVYYQALSAVSLAGLKKSSFKKLIGANPQLQTELLQKTLFIFDIFADRVRNLSLTSASFRIRHRLVYLSRRFGVWQGEKVTIKAPITHEIIANSVNATRETVSRELKKLQDRNVIDYDNHLIVILDMKKLTIFFSVFLLGEALRTGRYI